jgi:hypothetical protein
MHFLDVQPLSTCINESIHDHLNANREVCLDISPTVAILIERRIKIQTLKTDFGQFWR